MKELSIGCASALWPAPKSVLPGAQEPGTGDELGLHLARELPVVVLFGWVGCNDKHLRKYASVIV